MGDGVERFLCIASRVNGQDFLRQCAEMGVRPTLLTLDALDNGAWPHEALEELTTMPGGLNHEQILNTVSWMARERRFDRVIALDAGDLETVAVIREHMRIPGMGMTTAAYYRDRLAMRMGARDAGYLVPEFCRVLNYGDLREFIERIPPPWLLKPRLNYGLQDIHKIEDVDQLWRMLDDLGDRQSRFLLEEILSGDRFSVDAIISESNAVFSVVQQDGPPLKDESAEAGIATQRTVDRGGRAWMELTALNAGLAPSLGMVRGVTHAEYLRSSRDGRYYFQEIAARADGAFDSFAALGGEVTANLVEVASGVNLWREWARLEVTKLRNENYLPPEFIDRYAGRLICHRDGAEPGLEGCKASEIIARSRTEHLSGLIVRSENPERVEHLLSEFSAELLRCLSTPTEGSAPA